jgi:hypothetical protein
MSEKLLSVESDSAREVVEIHFDRNGLDYLIEALTRLRNESAPEHFHLMCREWGGDGLSETPQNTEFVAAKHVKFCLW